MGEPDVAPVRGLHAPSCDCNRDCSGMGCLMGYALLGLSLIFTLSSILVEDKEVKEALDGFGGVLFVFGLLFWAMGTV